MVSPKIRFPRLDSFPRDNKEWRIDWFGDVAYPDRHQSYRHPSILLALSQVPSGVNVNVAVPRTAQRQRQIWVPVGLLIKLRIGDIWRNGHLERRDDGLIHVVRNLKINAKTSRVVKAGIDINGSDFMLPASAHPGHMRHTKSHCMLIDLPAGKRMVIPCAELIRFYFGSSNWLLDKLFKPPLSKMELFRYSNYWEINGRLHLRLPPSASGYSASDIGRIALDQLAWRAAVEIGQSLLACSTRGESAYPITHFPFAGATDLTVQGEWLPFGKAPAQTLLVHSILSCTHPFPFRKLTYELARPQTLMHVRFGQKRTPDAPPSLTHARISQSSQSITNKDPSKRLAMGIWYVDHGIKFPDLESKTVFRLLDATNRQNTVHPFRHSATKISTSAVGEATGTGRYVRPLELATRPLPFDTSGAPDFLRDYLEQVAAIPNIEVSVLTESHDDGWSVPIDAMQSDSRKVDPRLFIRVNRKKKIRRASVFLLQSPNRPACHLTVIEGKPG